MAGILTHEQKQLAFRLHARGWPLVDIAREIGCSAPMVGPMVRTGRFTTGVEDQWQPRPGCLGIVESEDILVGLRAGTALAEIARSLGRATSTISREVNANGGRSGYSAWGTHRRARVQARRPKHCKPQRGQLHGGVARRLQEPWSPDEIARRLPLDFPDDPEMRVSHQTIYQSPSRRGCRASCGRHALTAGSGPVRGATHPALERRAHAHTAIRMVTASITEPRTREARGSSARAPTSSRVSALRSRSGSVRPRRSDGWRSWVAARSSAGTVVRPVIDGADHAGMVRRQLVELGRRSGVMQDALQPACVVGRTIVSWIPCTNTAEPLWAARLQPTPSLTHRTPGPVHRCCGNPL
jgi:hypothetical protein